MESAVVVVAGVYDSFSILKNLRDLSLMRVCICGVLASHIGRAHHLALWLQMQPSPFLSLSFLFFQNVPSGLVCASVLLTWNVMLFWEGILFLMSNTKNLKADSKSVAQRKGTGPQIITSLFQFNGPKTTDSKLSGAREGDSHLVTSGWHLRWHRDTLWHTYADPINGWKTRASLRRLAGCI